MLAISLIGVTPGLEMVTFGKLPFQPTDDWVGISTSDIEVKQHQSLYIINRRIVEGNILTWIGYYKFAVELGGSRDGGFYGAGIWLLGKVAPGDAIVRLLPLLADQVKRLAMRNGQFVKRLSAIREQFQWPEVEGTRLNQSLADLEVQRGLGVADLPRAYLDLSSANHAPYIGWFLDWIQNGLPFSQFNHVILSTDAAVTTAARAIGRLKLITPDGLLREETKQENSATKLLLQATQDLTEAQRVVNQFRISNVGLEQKLQRLQQEVLESRSRASQLQAAFQNATDQIQKHQDTIDRLREQLNKSIIEQRQLSIGLQTAKRDATTSHSVRSDVRPTTEAFTGEEDIWQSPNRVVKSRQDLLKDFESQMGTTISERDKYESKFRISNRASVHGQNNQNYNEIVDSSLGRAQPWYEISTTFAYFSFVALTVIGIFIFLLWGVGDPSKMYAGKLQSSQRIKSTPQACESVDLSKNDVLVRFTTQRFVSINEATKFVWRNVCSSRGPICANSDSEAITKQFHDSGKTRWESGVLGVIPGSDVVIRLPLGCSFVEIEANGLALSVLDFGSRPATTASK